MSDARVSTVIDLLRQRAHAHPRKPCVVIPETGVSVSYSELILRIESLAEMLMGLGLSAGDRVAILLPNSSEFLVAYFGTMAAGGIAVPTNPSSKRAEVQTVLRHSGARFALVRGDSRPQDDISIAEGEAVPSGLFCLCWSGHIADESERPVVAGDALLMYTSGTTGAPKAVMLQHSNLLAAVSNITSVYGLSEEDTALCVLPLTHIHGQVASMLSTVCSGGTLVLPHRFSTSHFWEWVDRYRATWFTAVPTIFSLLMQQGLADGGKAGRRLRFARSASAPLPASLLDGFEDWFSCPVVEAYDLTEATHQAASNPLRPGVRKRSSVGTPSGIEIEVLGENGSPLSGGEEGELVLRGPSISRGYFRNDQANAEAFRDQWFHTGDLGRRDSDGYVFITGRKKEQINRGGQKISPRDVDEVLYRHPKVLEAATVGVPHPVYGEEVESYVVLRPGKEGTERELMDHCAIYLADYKCPKTIRFVSELPKSANGKVQRLKLLEARVQGHEMRTLVAGGTWG